MCVRTDDSACLGNICVPEHDEKQACVNYRQPDEPTFFELKIHNGNYMHALQICLKVVFFKACGVEFRRAETLGVT